MSSNHNLPLEETLVPDDEVALAAIIAESAARGRAVYPIGGGTALRQGLVPRRTGLGLSTAKLVRLVDYPARDMTVTVGAGMTFAELARILAAEGQRLPLDPPRPEQATLGGILATNTSGPRRYGRGTIRDYVIGITAVDGQGTLFHGGGRVVKNVAGYDFCRLLTGSLGMLAVVTQLTLKVVPIPRRTELVACAVDDWDGAERLLAELVTANVTPAAVQLAIGNAWQDAVDLPADRMATLLVGLEGTEAEVDWMRGELMGLWRGRAVDVVAELRRGRLWDLLSEFPVAGESELVLQANCLPSATVGFCQLLRDAAREASLLADGNGHVVATLPRLPADPAALLVRQLQPAVASRGGQLCVLHVADPQGFTRQMILGGRTPEVELVAAIKREFDPRNILNPGRFWFD